MQKQGGAESTLVALFASFHSDFVFPLGYFYFFGALGKISLAVVATLRRALGYAKN